MTVLLDFSRPHVLRNGAEYEAAVAEVESLLDRNPGPGTPDHERLEFLSVLVEAYDETNYPMGETSTPQGIVDFMLDQRGMTRVQLAPILGGRSRVSDFFNGKRHLSLGQMAALRDLLGIPADLLLPKRFRRARRSQGKPAGPRGGKAGTRRNR